ncbi:Mitochondrial basic amino acids transporter (Carnitine/acylcarnitine translocase-like) (CACT-like) (Mitochondrial carnitine/acylcarnitine carrier protein CACL) (Mitochondrial ornithine transporter 3) (Solute carrier family 25 member 29) [Durusdinium trenchii]|uniref:Uncharacterized protein n=1 Tax=Durusdinium trenchii TaxID=1381693 RepID=A0ABP0L6V1_9DINO
MASEAARDFFGGTLGGMTGILAGHPLDTAKTRLQAMPQFDKSSTQRVLVETVRGEGMRALYKGISFPFCSTALINAVVFSVQGISERTLRAVFSDDRPQLTGFLGGCIAGLAQSPLVCAVDLVKTQRQVQMGWAGERPLQIFRNRIRHLGFRQGALQGLGPTAVKECPSYGASWPSQTWPRHSEREIGHRHKKGAQKKEEGKRDKKTKAYKGYTVTVTNIFFVSCHCW